jgi:predicted SnoaL-like aldol condensation-catalyzing enzyme
MAGRLGVFWFAVESPAANKALIERMHADLLGSRDPGRVDLYFGPRFISHNTPPGFPSGVEGVREFFASFAEALGDIEVAINVILAEGDLVAVGTTTSGIHRGRLLGVAPTGRRLEIDGTDIVRVEDGSIVEHWGLTNTVGVLEQVGPLARLRWLARLVAGQPRRARTSASKSG